ncbi:hypothetical protein H1Q63_35390 [Desmonostoc muscorum CCALA 125]|nr:hypothetical protein [Desmonostoc muscorum CCALA 125]
MGSREWGLGIGDWGLGIGYWGLTEKVFLNIYFLVPSPQSPLPIPHSPLPTPYSLSPSMIPSDHLL